VSEHRLSAEWPADDLEHVSSCPICGSRERVLAYAGLEDRLFSAAPGKWQLWRCPSCGCAYLDPRPTRESIGVAYSRYFPRQIEAPTAPALRLGWLRAGAWNGYVNRRFGYSLEPANRVGALILSLFPKRRWSATLTVRGLQKPSGRPRLLDVGFGDASFLRFMASAGWETAGLEINEEAVTAARASGLDVELGTIEEAPYDEGSFDAITLSHVVEHLDDPVASLRACFALLRFGGILWLATPNLDSPGHRCFGANWFGLDPPRHIVLFNIHSLDQALGKAGFGHVSHPRTYRAGLLLAGSEALASGRDATSAITPESPALRLLAVFLDAAATVHPQYGEEVVAVARKAR
jgi:2-polyprenyl-3-methyl-5-hydroxy-6-metoxy-1,4-benzoquinol methylase